MVSYRQVVLELERDRDQISGSLASAGAKPQRFYGWLELMAALEDARALASDPASEDPAPVQQERPNGNPKRESRSRRSQGAAPGQGINTLIRNSISAGRLAMCRMSDRLCSPLRLLSLTALLLAVGGTGSASAGTVTFATPGEQTFTVPPGVTKVHVDAVGGRGGKFGNHGAAVSADLTVVPGQRLYVDTAGNGDDNLLNAGGNGGFGGGGAGGNADAAFSRQGGGGGGGASVIADCRVLVDGCSITDMGALIVASGGGGNQNGGPGYGDPTSSDTAFTTSRGGGHAGGQGGGASGSSGSGGRGGSATGGAGDPGGSGDGTTGGGSFVGGTGGTAGAGKGFGGSGGGGGYGGGGGGSSGSYGSGGGGGSSFVISTASNPMFSADTTGNPQVTFNYVDPPPTPAPPAPAPPAAPPVFAPGPPSSNFTLARVSVGRDGTITISVIAPGPGTFSASATTSSRAISAAGVQSAKKKCKKGFVRKGKKCKATIAIYGTGSATAAVAGALKITIHPSAAAKRALKKGKRLKVALAVKFQATGGTATTKNSSVSVKLKKKKGMR